MVIVKENSIRVQVIMRTSISYMLKDRFRVKVIVGSW